jgi:hypothetical protein
MKIEIIGEGIWCEEHRCELVKVTDDCEVPALCLDSGRVSVCFAEWLKLATRHYVDQCVKRRPIKTKHK